MTPQEAKELLPIIEAYANGETIQIRTLINGWYDITHDPIFNAQAQDYRIKPKPRRVPMTAEDLPAVFWVQHRDGGAMKLITCITEEGDLDAGSLYLASESFIFWRWSTDRKTWQDFTKEVAE